MTTTTFLHHPQAVTALLAATAVSIAPPPVHASPKDHPTTQATSTIPIDDDRIAALWISNPGSPGTPPVRECTTSYLGNNFWITAHHCVTPDMSGYLTQPDGQTTGIAATYTLSNQDDIALVKTGPGITATTFTLPTRTLEIGEQATLLGYAITHDYASAATTTITDRIDNLDVGTTIYTDIYQTRSVTDSRSCNGDSGGPIYQNNTIYAVHTAGSYNPTCTPGQDRPMWHTNLTTRVPWITTTMTTHQQLTAEEAHHAAEGLATAPPAPTNPTARNGSSLSSF